ncbi:hypothetical protein [Terrilactibacillus laevilacticus]|uniref:Uncharacterized protein n=1 Tax=Terrilactibacillus laevilacticus TaxID=1380157 RepID=A0ABW5PQB4_9BACI|nr:hypothetical protein [Terrilactibacillus laevilacticus]
MSEEKNKPKTIHVDTLRVIADKVIIEPKSDHPHHEPRIDDTEPIMRDFWGFPIPRHEIPHESDTTSESSSEKK